MSKHILLLGFMGSGKTTIGRLLGERLGRPFVDLDDRIEAAAGKPIAEIFASEGEAAFRDIEARELARLLAESGGAAVIALGGGAFAQARNRETIGRSAALTVHLECPLDTLRERCAGFLHRPLARDPFAFARLYEDRLPVYGLAEIAVGTGSGTPEEVVSAIAARLADGL